MPCAINGFTQDAFAWAGKFLNITWITHHLDWESRFCSLPKFSNSFFDQTRNESFTTEDSIHNELSTNVNHKTVLHLKLQTLGALRSCRLISQLPRFMKPRYLITKMMFSGHGTLCSVCDFHVPVKSVRIRSQSLSWMDNSIRWKMNLRYKLFKTAICNKDQNIYARYKRVRNEITSELRKATSRYFNEKIASVRSAAAYWNLIAEATNPQLEEAKLVL